MIPHRDEKDFLDGTLTVAHERAEPFRPTFDSPFTSSLARSQAGNGSEETDAAAIHNLALPLDYFSRLAMSSDGVASS